MFLICVAYLIYMLERFIGNVWIGLYHEPYSMFKFVDETSTPHTYWGAGQPNRLLGQRSCTQANVTGSNFGVWDDVPCSTSNPFICEIYQGMILHKILTLYQNAYALCLPAPGLMMGNLSCR